MSDQSELATAIAKALKERWIIIAPTGTLQEQVDNAPTQDALALVIDTILLPSLKRQADAIERAVEAIGQPEHVKRENLFLADLIQTHQQVHACAEDMARGIELHLKGHVKHVPELYVPLVEWRAIAPRKEDEVS